MNESEALELPRNRVTVKILEEEYVIRGTAPESHVTELAAMVDSRATKIMTENPRLGLTRAVVLTALNFADDYVRLKAEHDRLAALFEEEWAAKRKKKTAEKKAE